MAAVDVKWKVKLFYACQWYNLEWSSLFLFAVCFLCWLVKCVHMTRNARFRLVDAYLCRMVTRWRIDIDILCLWWQQQSVRGIEIVQYFVAATMTTFAIHQHTLNHEHTHAHKAVWDTDGGASTVDNESNNKHKKILWKYVFSPLQIFQKRLHSKFGETIRIRMTELSALKLSINYFHCNYFLLCSPFLFWIGKCQIGRLLRYIAVNRAQNLKRNQPGRRSKHK